MLTVIAGSRSIGEYSILDKVMWEFKHVCSITGIIGGKARGVDSLGEHWAAQHELPFHSYPAEWDKYGMSAGFRRNTDMYFKMDAAVILWDGVSAGTKHMLQLTLKKGVPYALADQHGRIVEFQD